MLVNKRFRPLVVVLTLTSCVFADGSAESFIFPMGMRKVYSHGDHLYTRGIARPAGQPAALHYIALQAWPVADPHATKDLYMPGGGRPTASTTGAEFCVWSMDSRSVWNVSVGIMHSAIFFLHRAELDDLFKWRGYRATTQPEVSEIFMPIWRVTPLETPYMRMGRVVDNKGRIAIPLDIAVRPGNMLELYILLDGKMSIWTCEFDAAGKAPKSQPAIRGPSLIRGRDDWQRMATFDVPFKSGFAAVRHRDDLFLVSEDGKCYQVLGLDFNKRLTTRPAGIAGEADPEYPAGGARLWLAAEDFDITGDADPSIRTELLEEMAEVKTVLFDLDRDAPYFIGPHHVWNTSGESTPRADDPSQLTESAKGAIRDALLVLPRLKDIGTTP